MARSSLTLILLVAVFARSDSATNPGFRTTITNKGLDYVRQVAIPILENALSSLSIPDISGSAGTPIGSIDYSLSNIKLSGLAIPTSSLTTSSSGITVSASGLTMKVNANWHYREHSWPHISDSGSCDISVSSVSLSVVVVMGVDSNGHPTLSATSCSLNIGHLDITFHGGASWLYNLFSGTIASSLKGSIAGQVCNEAKNEINTDGNKALESLPVVEKIDDVSEIDYTLLLAPIFTSSYVETNHKGEFYAIANHQEAPFTPPTLPVVNDTGKMMYVWLTEYIADTAGFVYQQAGVLNYNVTPNMVPKGLPLQLNTTSFKLLLPQLYNAYPNMAMSLGLETVKPPNLDIIPTSANFTIPGQVKVFVQDSKSNATVLAFTLGAGNRISDPGSAIDEWGIMYRNVYADVKVWVHSNNSQEIISANATYLRADLSLVQTNIGQFSVALLQGAFTLMTTTFVIPVINSYANKGIPIPIVDGVSFVDAEIQFGKGYVLVGTDFNYKPTFLSPKIHNLDQDYL